MIDLVEAAGLLLLTVVVGGTLFDIYGERGFKKRRNTRSATRGLLVFSAISDGTKS